jgi:hypothetical protein
MALDENPAFFDHCPADQIDVCPVCAAPRLRMLACDRAGEKYAVAVVCPDCEWSYCGLFSLAQVGALADAMQEATDAMLADLRRLRTSRQEAEVAAFRDALASGLLTPDDF